MGSEHPDYRDESLQQQMTSLIPRLRRFARALAKDPSRADDLVQSACERALGRLSQMEKGTRLDSWLYRIIYTQWIDRLRRAKTRTTHLKALARECSLDENSAGMSCTQLASAMDLRKAISSLPEDHRAAMLLVCLEGHTYAEAAQVLAVPAGTVASRVARAREALTRILRSDSAKVVAMPSTISGRTERK